MFDPPPRIDWLPASDLADGRPGRIGMTVLPGKRGPSLRYPGLVYRADLDQDLAALGGAGIGRLILLVDDKELARWTDPALVERAAGFGVEVRRHPMSDGSAPRSTTEMDEILRSLTEARSTADVGVACMGGVGRTGTVAACALVSAGWEADAAIARIRELRHPLAVETKAQEHFVQMYWSERGTGSARVAP